jgi:hypothetical protein
MTEKMYEAIIARFEKLEDTIELYMNPSKLLSVNEKAMILKEAIATGDKAKIKEATRRINGK